MSKKIKVKFVSDQPDETPQDSAVHPLKNLSKIEIPIIRPLKEGEPELRSLARVMIEMGPILHKKAGEARIRTAIRGSNLSFARWRDATLRCWQDTPHTHTTRMHPSFEKLKDHQFLKTMDP